MCSSTLMDRPQESGMNEHEPKCLRVGQHGRKSIDGILGVKQQEVVAVQSMAAWRRCYARREKKKKRLRIWLRSYASTFIRV